MSSHLHSADKITTDGGKLSTHGLIKFLVPSLIGILLFLVPFSVGDTINIGMGLAADWLKATLGDALPGTAAEKDVAD